ncbi:hypothetical protein C0033_04270 [Clostridium sp. chh4-2]|uniref:hypothetical protein n=1 Tax=Clostridium sp. chh4-2 TaxID=2067550 RepID=UPI000CCE927B|nr:hypothetical protein [Clostridium sp. chh4-2]PNV63302.1 hypothetical protein C0033_04270 [Clostridium sp. chh4-2]
MKNRKMNVMLAAALLSAVCSFTAFAGEWKQDDAGWKYDNGDLMFIRDGWSWIDGKCYYFTPEGYCLTDTVTPDGYTVDADGAWTVDGRIQTQNVPALPEHTLGDLVFTTPDGFSLNEMSKTGLKFFSSDYETVIAIGKQDYNVKITDEDLDYTAASSGGDYSYKAMTSFNNTTWRKYYFETTGDPNISSMAYYYRTVEKTVYIIIIATNNQNEPFKPDSLMLSMVNKASQ